MSVLYSQAYCAGYFTGKVSQLSIDLQKLQKISTMNDLQ